MKKIVLGIFLCVALLMVAGTVQAGPFTTWTGYFTSDHITGGYGQSPPGGSVVLTLGDYDSDGSADDVHFKVTLDDGSKFVNTEAGDRQAFKFNGNDVALGDIIVSSGMVAATGNFNGDGGGMFHFGVAFSSWGHGASDARSGPIEFNVVNASIEDLIGLNDKNQIFVADVISGISGFTGLIDVSGQAVPEPTTLLLLGFGLVGLAGVRRFRK